MTPKRIRYTQRADRDLNEIWDFVAGRSGKDRADYVVAEIRTNVRKLAEFPWLGHKRADVRRTTYRVWTVFSFLVLYRIKGGDLIVSRVVHGHRDMGRLFG
jgi:toxin ParE1/3/4